MRRRRRGEWQQARHRYDKSRTSKIYTTWARILSGRNIFCTLRVGGGGDTSAGTNCVRQIALAAFHVLRKIARFNIVS